MSMSWLRMLVLLCVAALTGCFGDDTQQVKPPEVSPKDAVKAALEDVAESGQGGSALGGIMQELSKLEESDPQLAQELRKETQTMMSSSMSPDQVKQKAKEMIKKLEGGGSGG